jgi:tetratricopeptide (TPR) repeat protein
LRVLREAARLQPQYAAAHLRLAILYRRQRSWREAEAALEKAESLYRTFANIEGEAEVLYQRAVLARVGGRHDQARGLLDRALGMVKTAGNPYQHTAILLQFSNVCFRQGRPQDAEKYASEALRAARGYGLPDLTARALLELGDNAHIRGDNQVARKYLADALEAARRFGGSRTEARALLTMGAVRMALGETEAGLKDLAAAKSFYEKGAYRRELDFILILEGRAKTRKGDLAGALASAQKQIENARAAGDPEQLALSLAGAGAILLKQERPAAALVNIEEMRRVTSQANDQVNLRWAMSMLGDALWRLGRYNDAQSVLKEAAGLASTGSDRAALATIETVWAELELSRRKPQAVRTRIRRALALDPDDKNNSAMAATLLARTELLSGRVGAAVQLSTQAVQRAEAIGDARLVLDALLAHAEALLAASERGGIEIARRARAMAERSGQKESGLRAALMGILAARAENNLEGERENRSAARRFWDEIRRGMAAENLKTYFARPDIRHVEQQLARIMPAGQDRGSGRR